MTGRTRRGSRQANMKARIGLAAAVLVGGGAAGVAAVAANNHGPATTNTAEASFIMSFHHRISEAAALTSALNAWHRSHQSALSTLAQMVPMRTFSQVWAGGRHHRTEYAAQRGVVVLATTKFMLVQSANGRMELWWLTGGTQFMNVAANPTGMTAMTGNNTATVAAVVHQNTAPAAAVMAGSAAVVNQMAQPVVKPITITVNAGNEVITITITVSSATVTPTATATGTTSATPTATATATATGMPTATSTAHPTMTATPTMTGTATTTATPTVTATPTMTATPTVTATPTMTATPVVMNGVARGDLVMIAGIRFHGRLFAQLVLFSVPATTTPTPTVTSTVTGTTPVTARPTVTGTSGAFSGHNS